MQGSRGFASVYIRLEGPGIVEQKLTALTHETVKFDRLALQADRKSPSIERWSGGVGLIVAPKGILSV